MDSEKIDSNLSEELTNLAESLNAADGIETIAKALDNLAKSLNRPRGPNRHERRAERIRKKEDKARLQAAARKRFLAKEARKKKRRNSK